MVWHFKATECCCAQLKSYNSYHHDCKVQKMVVTSNCLFMSALINVQRVHKNSIEQLWWPYIMILGPSLPLPISVWSVRKYKNQLSEISSYQSWRSFWIVCCALRHVPNILWLLLLFENMHCIVFPSSVFTPAYLICKAPLFYTNVCIAVLFRLVQHPKVIRM